MIDKTKTIQPLIDNFFSLVDKTSENKTSLPELSSYAKYSLLPRLNDIVSDYQRESEAISKRQQNLLLLVLAALILLIASGTLFIFNPLLKLYFQLFNTLKEEHNQALLSRQTYTDILNSIRDPIFVKNIKHEWIMMNNEFAKILGKNVDDLIGKSESAFFPPDITNDYYESDNEVFSTDQTVEKLQVFHDENGKTHQILTKKSRSIDQNGNTILIDVIRDVTEQLRSYTSLQNYRFAINQAAIVSITDTKGIITYCNENFTQVSGYSEESVLGQNHNITNSCHHSKEFFKELWETVQSGRVWRGEIKNKKIEEDFKAQHQFITRVTNSIPSIIYVRNVATDSIVYSNQRISDVLGYTQEELFSFSGNLVNLLSHPDDLAIIKSAREKLHLIGDHQTVDIEFRLKHKDGRWIWCHDYGAIFERDANGTPLLSLGFAQDISSKKEALDTLNTERIKAAYASKMATLGEMASGVAHEINNPLTVILGLTRQLQRQHRDNNIESDSFEKNLDKIENMTNRISRIVKSLSTFSRSADRDPMLDTSISKIINETLELCLEKFRIHQVQLSVDIKDDFIISCREVQISQVLINLLNNSYDAIQSKEEKWIKLSAIDQVFYIEIIITDSGNGISKELAEKIMQIAHSILNKFVMIRFAIWENGLLVKKNILIDIQSLIT